MTISEIRLDPEQSKAMLANILCEGGNLAKTFAHIKAFPVHQFRAPIAWKNTASVGSVEQTVKIELGLAGNHHHRHAAEGHPERPKHRFSPS